jgi:hypothetical protein
MMDYQDVYAGMYNPTDTQYGTPYQGPDGRWYDSRGNLIPGQDQQQDPTRQGPVTAIANPATTQGPGAAPPTAGGGGVEPPPPPPPDTSTGPLANFSEPAPTFPNEPAYTPGTFSAPSFDEALNDPGYKFGVQQGEASLGNWAAARGTLNDSDTGKMFIDYGRNAAQQGYGNVYARDFGTWQANEQARQSAYGMNRQTQYIDPWTASYNAWAQRGNWYLGNQGNVVNAAIGFGNL